MQTIHRIIETYQEFLNEGGLTGGATYGVTVDPGSTGSIGHEYMELLVPLVKGAKNIMDRRVWDNLVKCVAICREEIIEKLKSDNHQIPDTNEDLTKEFIKNYGQDYVASFLIKRIQS